MNRESLWLRLEPLILNLIEANGESRNSLGPKLGFSRNHLGRILRTAEERRANRHVRPDFDLAFQIAGHYGIQPTTLLAPFAQDAPESLLQILPCDPDQSTDTDVLDAIAALESRVVGNVKRFPELWVERRSGETELARIYAELEELENRRHYAAHEVAETCRSAILDSVDSGPGSLGYTEAMRLTGIVGIWGSVQRRQYRLFQARESLRHSLIFARRLGDLSLHANQLQRASYVFRELDAHELAVGVLRESSELYRIDRNEIGAACTLIDRALVAAHQDHIVAAERLYRTGIELIPPGEVPPYRLAALQGLATCRDLLGDVEGSLVLLQAAADAAPCSDTWLTASLLYTGANIQRRLRRHAEATESYWRALEIFSSQNAADAVLRVCLDLAACLIQSGNRSAIPRVSETASKHLPKLRNRRTLQLFQYELLLRELVSDEPREETLRSLRKDIDDRRRS